MLASFLHCWYIGQFLFFVAYSLDHYGIVLKKADFMEHYRLLYLIYIAKTDNLGSKLVLFVWMFIPYSIYGIYTCP